MIYPELQDLHRQQITTGSWGGYNHNARIPEGDSFDERNIGSDFFPLLAPRGKRGVYAEPGNPQGLIAKDTLCWVDGPDFVMHGYHYQMQLSTREADCPKRLVSMGAYVVIMPDKKYINTSDTSDMGSIEASVTAESANVSLCNYDAEMYDNTIVSDTEPADKVDGTYWIDTGSKPNSLKQWSESESMWVEVGTTYVRISAPGIGTAFKDGDGVTLTGWESAESEEAQKLMGAQIIWRRDADWILITGIVTMAGTVPETLTVKRTMPDMDFVIESGNRLWGCRYGIAKNGETVNEIYASKLGDFKNWNVFIGVSTDAWAGNLGSDGQFTGAINYLGYPTFFKSGHIHRVTGSMPSQYSIRDTVCRGVQKGSDRSLAMVNERLIYKSDTGVCIYDGSLPSDISTAFGQEHYTDAVAGAIGDRYYISMIDSKTGEPVLMTYNMAAGIWHKEDGLRPMCFEAARNQLYCIEGGRILCLTGAGEPEAEPVKWEIVTGEIGLVQNSGFATVAMPEQKRIGKLMLRMQLEPKSRIRIAAMYDDDGVWQHIAEIKGGTQLRSFNVPIRPRRCDWMRLKLTGTGMAKVYSMQRYMEAGSEFQTGESMTVG